MARGDYLGEFEELVLLAVVRCGHDAYGMEVRREIAARTGREVSIGAVYATMERLAAKSLVRAVSRTRDADQDGRPRKFYEITRSGDEALAVAESIRLRMRQGLRPRIRPTGR